MPSTDNRIVQMQFDNHAFQEKVAGTIASLDKLKTSLDFAHSSKGLSDLNAAGANFSLAGMASAVEGMAGKFTAMGAIAFSVINSIVSKAVDAGIGLAKSLSLDQLTAGFREYETNMNAIQTVLANTKADGTNLQDVNKALDELNQYSDKTIYNFGEMAKNIGTFTAAGVSLDTSTQAIKGIANLAAISGSNSQQASTAMYQLSQAMASGTVKLMDWNSIVNAGMGGEVFQKSLFETGKTLGTIKDVPIGMTFEQWTAAGNTFRGSLETGWLTAEVLTNTLSGFTGDMTDAQLLAMGYNAEQIKQIQEMGQTGKEAATKVKTFTQLISTIKESIGSGWSESFRTIIGDFEEAKEIFTGINTYIGGIFGASADARNELLSGWKELGGRSRLIETLMYTFKAMADVVGVVKAAFRDIFPAATSQSLYDLTVKLRDFMAGLQMSTGTISTVRQILTGVFAALKIGIEVVKGIVGVIVDLFSSFKAASGGGILEFLRNLANDIVGLKEKLVDGGGIAKFFDSIAPAIIGFVKVASEKFRELISIVAEAIDYFKVGFSGMGTNEGEGLMLFANKVGMAMGSVRDYIKELIPKFVEFKDKVGEVIDYFKVGFSGMGTNEGEGILLFANKIGMAIGSIKDWLAGLFDGPSGEASDKIGIVDAAMGRLGERFGWISGIGSALSTVWEKLSSSFGGVFDVLSGFMDFVQEKFSGLPQAIADALAHTEYSEVLDSINTGLFGGLVLAFTTFTKNFTFDGGIFKNIKQALGEVTDTLEAMQLKLKSEALLNIAIALGVMTASMILISLIDSGALTKGLLAMGTGFALLASTMEILDKMVSGPMGAAKLGILAGALILLSVAILVLSVAAKNMDGMDWEEMAKGMTGVTTLLGIMSVAVIPLSKNSGGMIRAGLGIMAIAVALNIMALAVKAFAEMSWTDMSKGMAGVATGLGLIVAAVQLLPSGMVSKSVGLMAIGVALNIIALAVKSFAQMAWSEMAKGMAGVAASLLIIAAATQLMPNGASLALQGAGLLLIGIGLVSMAQAIGILGDMSWEDMARGLTGIAATLGLLAVASLIMQNSLGGAIAIGILAISLGALADGLKEFSGLSWKDLLKGLAGIAGIMAVLGLGGILMQPAIPALLGLGVALLLLGGGFALFGLGASLVATAFSVIATAGTQGVAVLLEALEGIIGILPEFIESIGEGVILLVQKIIDALPEIISGLSTVITALLQLVIDNIPKIIEVFTTFIHAGLQAIRDVFPDILQTGIDLLMEFLRGIRDNIGEVVTTVADIITNFLDALSLKVPEIIDSVFNFVKSVVEGVIAKMADIGEWLFPRATELIGGFLRGIVEKAEGVVTWFKELPGKILEWIGELGTWLKEKGIGIIGGFLLGIIDKAVAVELWWLSLPGKVLGWLGDLLSILLQKGKDLLQGLWDGAVETFDRFKTWISGFPGVVGSWMVGILTSLLQTGKDLVQGLWDGAVEIFNSFKSWISGFPNVVASWLGDLGSKLFQLGKDLIQGLWNGAKDIWEGFKSWLSNLNPANWFNDINPYKGHAIKNLVTTGEAVIMGLQNGMQSEWKTTTKWLKTIDPSEHLDLSKTANVMTLVADQLGTLEEFNPTITPVLDLTNVEKGAVHLSHLLSSQPSMGASLSYNQAALLAASSRIQEDSSTADTKASGPIEVKFEQHNHSPKALSTSDIYRQTRNQIAMAKEELAVL